MSLLEEYHLQIKPLFSAGLLSLYITFQFFILQEQRSPNAIGSASSFFSKITKNLGNTSPCWNQNTIAAQFMFVGLKTPMISLHGGGSATGKLL